MVLNQCCQLSMELIKTYYELSIFGGEKTSTAECEMSHIFLFFYKKKVEGGGGWMEK